MKEGLPLEKRRALSVDLIAQSLESGIATQDNDMQMWNRMVEQILAKNGTVIALRGAGSINGADLEESDRLLETQLIPRVEEALASCESVTFFFDGDLDSPERPDIGYFAGRLIDKFGNNSNGVSFVVAQKQSWYYPKREGENLVNANGKAYVTYVFADGMYEGDHNSFTQDASLVESANYEQWYIGASGEIASSQLADFNAKVPKGQSRKVVLFRVRNNGILNHEIQAKLNEALGANDKAKADKFKNQLSQRQRIYGAHWDNDGRPAVATDQFPSLEFSFVA